MSIIVNCHCGRKLKAPEKLLGKETICPACGARIVIGDTVATDNGLPQAERAATDETYRVSNSSASENIASQDASVTPSHDSKACPFCGETILAVARKCKHCGEYLDPTLREQNTHQVQVPPKRNEYAITDINESSSVFHSVPTGNEEKKILIALLLLIFLPPISAFYADNIRRGVWFLCAIPLGYLFVNIGDQATVQNNIPPIIAETFLIFGWGSIGSFFVILIHDFIRLVTRQYVDGSGRKMTRWT